MSFSVYVARDEAGNVLYVGMTGCGLRRLHQHRRDSEWWDGASSISLEHFMTEAEARDREAELIVRYRPPNNRLVPTRRLRMAGPPKPSKRGRVAQLTEQGLKVREIATVLNVSTQAVYKHLKALELAPPTQRQNDEPAA